MQHNFNPLHIYCRLMDVGVPHALAYRIAGWWGNVYDLLFWRRN
ncbi:MAG: hypothetical protein WCQ59_09855 [Candidatus Cloacimonadaceae bacterium]